MPLPRVTIEGRVVADPELRFLPSGVAVATFSVAANDRKLNRDTNQWEDGDTCFLKVSCWRNMAENVAESLHRGDHVIVVGKIKQQDVERDGQRRTFYEVDADAVGPGLNFATARVTRAQRQQGGQQQGQQQGGDPWSQPQGQPPGWGQDPWTNQPTPPLPPQQGEQQQAPPQQPPQQQPPQGWPPPPQGPPQGGWSEPPF